MFGLLMEREVASAEKVMHESEKPFLAIGGAKVSDKILIIENLLDRATDIIIGGISDYDGNSYWIRLREPPLRSLMWAMHPSGYKLQRARLMRSY